MILQQIQGGLVVSCQALEGEPLHGARHMAAMAKAAELGGAAGIRANGPADIAAIREAVALPIIGIHKLYTPGYEVYITPTFESAAAVAAAGANMIAIDGTMRTRPGPDSLPDLIRRIQRELGRPVMADCATVDEALEAAAAGADVVATTMAGYTDETRDEAASAAELVTAIRSYIDVPVIAEGRIWTPDEARRALDAGAHAVVVGSAITRPQEITRRFVQALQGASTWL